jgi:uncharacterized protein YijF (DUF1287 family)
MAHRLAAIDVKPHLARLRAAPRSLALPVSHDEREVMALLILPVLLVASAIAAHQSARTLHGYVTSITAPDQEIAARQSSDESAAAPAIETAARELAPNATLAPAAPEAAPPATLAPVTPEPVASEAAPLHSNETEIALLAPPPDLPGAKGEPDPLVGREATEEEKPAKQGICTVEEQRRATAMPVSFEPVPAGGEAFGRRLAEAAEAQVGSFVIYTDTYRSIRYPMGDVNRFFGVCTDLVVRAYRALGLDLQVLVHQARGGRGDPSIDHRRTETLRRFFATRGETLPVTDFPEDYRPGDIVTYDRPQNRRSRSHIAIVSNVVAPSGRPMIVHNRGWGPQLEDALFVDEITGHYRYLGPGQTRNAENAASKAGAGAPVVPASFSPQMQNSELRAE